MKVDEDKQIGGIMEQTFVTRFKNAWNVFMDNEKPQTDYQELGFGEYIRPDKKRANIYTSGADQSIITPIFNRIALDTAGMDVRHIKIDEDGRFLEEIDSKLNECLSISANIDQTGRGLIHDAVMSMLDEGVVAIIPVETISDPNKTNSYDIVSMRTGKILEWYPKHVKVEAYDERIGKRKEIIVSKYNVAIVESPLYEVLNKPNSTLKRLVRKLNLADIVDEQSSSGKLDLIIQLPYVIKTERQQEQAKRRKKNIEDQLVNSKYGIAYTDGTERITQLNRPVENNLLKQIEYLTSMLYSQLGITQGVLEGTASEQEMLNYYNRSIEPIILALTEEMARKFLTKTARSQHQFIGFFNDPFRLVSVNDIAEIADKFTRNEIMTSNEVRKLIKMRPVNDPNADELRNKNLSVANTKSQEQEVKESNQEDES